MYQSHTGLRYEYEVSCEELDFIVDWTRDQDEIIGSRMMGGGFGGTTISLVRKGYGESLFHKLFDRYLARFGVEPDFHPISLSDGIRIMP
jgi:galactokinase